MTQKILTDIIQNVAIFFPAFLLVFAARGCAKALMAKWMGDETAYQEGYATMNPLVHIDGIALFILLCAVFLFSALVGGRVSPFLLYNVLIFMGIRWRHSVPLEMRNLRNMKLGGTMAILAGPLGCFLLALVGLYVGKYLPYDAMGIGASKSLWSICTATVDLGLWFGVFHLIPIPPYDGGRLLQLHLPYSKQGFLTWLEEYNLFIILGLFFLPVVREIFFTILGLVTFFVKYILVKLVI